MRIQLIFAFLFIFLSAFSQNYEQYSQVKIDLQGKDILQLTKLGLETDHGLFAKGKFLVNIFNQREIQQIIDAGFGIEIIIEDMKTYFAERDPNVALDHHVHGRGLGCDDVSNPIENIETPENYTEGFMQGYYTLAEAYAIFDKMHEMYPELITARKPIGDIVTHEGREIYYLKLSDNVDMEEDEPEVLYNAITHAREPGGLTQMIFFLWHMLENYGVDDEVTYLINHTQLHFIPVINPDGYLYNERTDPNGGGFWRKNRYVNPQGDTVGVDLNRNFGYEWGFDDIGSSTDENSNTYRGTGPFSEPETQAVRQHCIDHDFKIALNYHTFGNLLIHPWGYNDQPTEEDAIFKAFGEIMTEHNDYLIGTGTETVGYTVNGDSDDYMYGDTIEKNKIYAFTPEVGPAFWAPQVMIDDINKYTLRENMNTAHLTLNYARAEEVDGEKEIVELTGMLLFDVTRYGLKEGNVDVSVVSLNNGMTIDANVFSFDLDHLETSQFEVAYQIDETLIQDRDEIEIEIHVDNGALVLKEKLVKVYRSEMEMPVTILELDNSTLDNFFVNGDWDITTEEFVSAPTSITDSPGEQYAGNDENFIQLTLPVDLSNALEANVRFWAKWDIEADYDYVQLQASADSQAFIPVCGIYTNTGTDDQDEGEPVFDGVQDEWVYEKMSLNELVGSSNVLLRFYMDSDFFVEGDGFYFDDFKVEIIEKEVSTIDEAEFEQFAKVSPNPGNGIYYLEVLISSDLTGTKLSVYDVQSKLIMNQDLNKEMAIDLSSYPNGNYILKIENAGTVLFSEKLIKITR